MTYSYDFDLDNLTGDELLTLDGILVRMIAWVTDRDEGDVSNEDEDYFEYLFQKYRKQYYGDEYPHFATYEEDKAWMSAMYHCIRKLIGQLSDDDIYNTLYMGGNLLDNDEEKDVWDKAVQENQSNDREYSYKDFTDVYDFAGARAFDKAKTENMRRRTSLKESMPNGGITLGYLLKNLLSSTQDVQIRDITSDPEDFEDYIARGRVSRILYEGKVKHLLNSDVTYITTTYGGDLVVHGFFLRTLDSIREWLFKLNVIKRSQVKVLDFFFVLWYNLGHTYYKGEYNLWQRQTDI